MMRKEAIVIHGLTRREAIQGMLSLAALPLGPDAGFGEPLPRNEADFDAFHKAGRKSPFNDGWRFHRGDALGAEQPAFDDSGWRALDVPHDWSIEDLPETADQGSDTIWTEGTNPVRVGPFDMYGSEGKVATGWVVGGIGWYRKTFEAPQVPAFGKVEIRFEGVYMNSDVWLNGVHLGNHPYGYTGFAYDLTPHLKPGFNMIAVRVNNTGRNSRWYSGSGIFRKVSLHAAGALRVPEYGISITTPEVTKDVAKVRIEVALESGASRRLSATVRIRLRDATGSAVGAHEGDTSIAAGSQTMVAAEITMKSPRTWSPADPQLYRAEIFVESGGQPADAASVAFGIRTIEVDAARGLRINGENIKLRGGCVHHDNGPLGSACIPRAEERRVELLKANGFNAVRTSHNPPSANFLEACDRLGMLVIDEAFDCWTVGKNPEDYHLYFKENWQRDLESMVLRDRNHPSVIFWSIGNEIPERSETAGVAIGKQLAASVKKLDPTRPVTAAICGPWGNPKQTWADMQAAFTYLDVGGYNYQWKSYAADHEAFPQRVMMGTESFPNEAYQNWSAVESNTHVIGDFVWTAMDYLGESGIGNASVSAEAGSSPYTRFYPWFNSYCGDIDLTGNKKAQSYYRDVVWGRSMIEMAVQRPVPSQFSERISLWGWSDELRSWTWPPTRSMNSRRTRLAVFLVMGLAAEAFARARPGVLTSNAALSFFEK